MLFFASVIQREWGIFMLKADILTEKITLDYNWLGANIAERSIIRSKGF